MHVPLTYLLRTRNRYAAAPEIRRNPARSATAAARLRLKWRAGTCIVADWQTPARAGTAGLTADRGNSGERNTQQTKAGSPVTRGIRELRRRGRRLARGLLHLPDRMLHAERRRRTERWLRARPPRTILVMCLGNICRSPFAAAALQRSVAGSGLRVESAGFLEDGRCAPEAAQKSALNRGVDLSAHRSQRVTDAMVQGADLVIVMDRGQRRALAKRFERREGVLVLGDLDPQPIDTRTIRDPFDQADEIFDQVYDRIERCVHVMTLCVRG